MSVGLLRLGAVLVLLLLVAHSLRGRRHVHKLLVALFIFVGLVLVYHIGARPRVEVHSQTSRLSQPRADRLMVKLRDAPATRNIDGDDLAVALRGVLFEMENQRGQETSPGRGTLGDEVVVRDGDSQAVKLRDLALLRRDRPSGEEVGDVMIEVTASRDSVRRLVEQAGQALLAYLNGVDGPAPFVVELGEGSLVISTSASPAAGSSAPARVAMVAAEAPEAPAPQEPPASPEAPQPPAPAAPAEAPLDAVAEKLPGTAAESSPVVTTAAPTRPAWVGEASRQQQGVYAIVVSAGPFSTTADCEREIDRQLIAETRRFLVELLGPRGIRLEPTLFEIRSWEDPAARFVEMDQDPELGPKYTMHARALIGPDVQASLKERFRQAIVQDRLGYFGAGSALLLAAVAVVYGYLRLDTATRGYYHGRLAVAAAVALALLVCIGLIVVRNARVSSQLEVAAGQHVAASTDSTSAVTP